MALDRAQVIREYSCAPREHNSFPPFDALPSDPDGRLDQWLDAARILPVSATQWDCYEDWILGPRVVNDSMWFYFTEGTGWGVVVGRGDRFSIQPGDLMLIPQGSEHIVRQDPGVEMKLIAVHFHAHVFAGLNLLTLAGFPCHARGGSLPATGTADTNATPAPTAPFDAVSNRLAREFALKAPGWRQAFSSGVLEVLLHLTRTQGSAFRPLGSAPGQGDLPRVLPALELIEARLTDPALNVVELAARLFVSEVQFRKLFRRATGLSPIRFIQRRRIEHACTLLRGTGQSIEQIAALSGFADAPFFYRVFKGWTGTTPALYRSRGRV